MKLKYIRFIFENCDSITIDGKYVGDFVVDDIRKRISRVASNAICEIDTTHMFFIEIHKDANVERYQLGMTDRPSCKQMAFDRFTKYNDITHIEFELEDGYTEEGKLPYKKDYEYSVCWNSNEDDGFENKCQTSHISKDGHLYIAIDENRSVGDFFDLEEIDDEDYMNFKFTMYGVGDGNGEDVIADEMFDEIYENIMGDESDEW